jgi:hypothetical protein
MLAGLMLPSGCVSLIAEGVLSHVDGIIFSGSFNRVTSCAVSFILRLLYPYGNRPR